MSVLVRSFRRYYPALLGYRAPADFFSLKIYFGGPGFTNPTGYARAMGRYFGDSISPYVLGGRRRGFVIFGGQTAGPDPHIFQP